MEYFDPIRGCLETFVLTYFPDRKLQLVHGKTGKVFISKIYTKDVTPRDLYIGNTIVICARQMSVVDYADKSTRKRFESLQTRGLVVVLPDAMAKLGEDGPKVALEVIVESAQWGFKDLLRAVDNIRERYGCGVFASKTPAEAVEHAREVFQEGSLVPPVRLAELGNAECQDCTLCIVKPHVVRQGRLGTVLSFITDRGFKILAMELMAFGAREAEELLAPYRGVVPYHADALVHLKSGPSVVIQVGGRGNVVESFREACGPADPEIARVLYPKSIRAVLGVDQAKNAVHATDLPEDGVLECQYVFGVVASGYEDQAT